jgi:hypothetical protein
MAAAMLRTYNSLRLPNLPPQVLDAFDKSYAYMCYVELIGDLLQGNDVFCKKFPSSWPNRLAAMQMECACASG